VKYKKATGCSTVFPNETEIQQNVYYKRQTHEKGLSLSHKQGFTIPLGR